jgi:hypothetical protein
LFFGGGLVYRRGNRLCRLACAVGQRNGRNSPVGFSRVYLILFAGFAYAIDGG